MPRFKPLAVLAAVSAAAVVVPAAAHADSIVFLKGGDVWLTSPDGAKAYAVTSGGGWDSPSQADDGTIVAQKGTLLVRMNRSGKLLGPPVRVVGDTGALNRPGFNFFGPYDPRVSPDGRRIAYWFKTQSATSVPGGSGGVTSDIEDWTTTTASDHFDSSPQTSVIERRQPHWLGNGRLLLTDPFGASGDQVSTWVPTGGASSEQAWFAATGGVMQDGEVSPDGAKLATTAATEGLTSAFNRLVFWRTAGPAWVGEPPYAYGEDAPRAATPSVACSIDMGTEAQSPSWSPDSNGLAVNNERGLWVVSLGAIDQPGSCKTFKLLVPGGSAPDWGPADVDMADKPGAASAGPGGTPAGPGTTPSGPATTPSGPGTLGPGTVPTGPGTGGPSTPPVLGGAAPTHVVLAPRSFRATRRATARLRYTLPGAGPVTLTVQRACSAPRCSRPVLPTAARAGRRGPNVVSFSVRSLPPGRYRLLVSGGGRTVRVAFRIAGA